MKVWHFGSVEWFHNLLSRFTIIYRLYDRIWPVFVPLALKFDKKFSVKMRRVMFEAGRIQFEIRIASQIGGTIEKSGI